MDEHYEVDDNMRETFQINMDMYVRTPCQYLDINVRDKTMDRKFVSKELNLEDMPFFIPYGTRVNDMKEIVTPDLDGVLSNAIPAQFRERLDTTAMFDEGEREYIGFDGCHIFGSIPVNRVAGELQITAKGYGYANFMNAPLEKIDFTHVVNELSYGEFYPYINNPLDSTAKFSPDQPRTTFIYDTAIVPTIYEKLGAMIDTNQYAVSEYHYNPESQGKGPLRIPGIFLRYDFEPLSIHVRDIRLSFLQFIVRLVAILSFITYTVSWSFRLIDLALLTCLGPRWSLRYQSDSKFHGILDKDPSSK